MSTNQKIIFDLVVYDILPFIIALAILILLVVYTPTIFVGLLLGWMACKYQDKLMDIYHKIVERKDGSSND